MFSEKLVTFVHISDTHIHTSPEHTEEYALFPSREPVAKLIAAINDLEVGVDFVLHTGDVMTDPENPEDYQAAREILRKLRYPVYYIPGNHDDARALQQVLLGRAEGEILARMDYQFDCNGAQFVMMDSSAPETAMGRLNDQQLAWLDAICSARDDRPLVVGIHHHPLPLQAAWLDTIVLENGVALHNMLVKARERLRGVFYGHIHESVVTARDGVHYYSVQSGWFQTRTWHAQVDPASDPLQHPGFNLVTLTAKDTFIRFIRVPVISS